MKTEEVLDKIVSFINENDLTENGKEITVIVNSDFEDEADKTVGSIPAFGQVFPSYPSNPRNYVFVKAAMKIVCGAMDKKVSEEDVDMLANAIAHLIAARRLFDKDVSIPGPQKDVDYKDIK